MTRAPDPTSKPQASDREAARDAKLLRRVAKGDVASLGSLAEAYEASLIGLARGLLNGRDDLARDAVQDTWVRVIRGARSFAGRSTPRTWIYRILINRCHDLRRRSARERAPVLARLPRAAEEEGRDPGDRLERAARVRAAAETLPDSQRLVLLLCYHRSLTHPQAAEVLDIPVGTLKSRLAAALTALRASVDERPPKERTGGAQA